MGSGRTAVTRGYGNVEGSEQHSVRLGAITRPSETVLFGEKKSPSEEFHLSLFKECRPLPAEVLIALREYAGGPVDRTM